MDPMQYTEVMTWLQIIGNNTRMLRETMEGRAGAGTPGTAGGAGKTDPTMLDKIRKAIEDGLRSGLSSGLGQAKALANRGFAGTMEQAQNNYAMDMLGKQFAAVMKPVMDGMTYLAFQVERRMKAMGGGEQNRLMGGLIGAGIGLRYGGLGGGIAGGALGSLVMGGESSYGGGIAGAYAGYRLGGPVGAAAGYAVGSVAGSGDYGRLRREGGSRVGAAFGAGIGSLTDMGHAAFGPGGLGLGSGPNPMTAIRADSDARTQEGPLAWMKRRLQRGGDDGRRDVTPFSADMNEAGALAASLQKGTVISTAGEGFKADGGPFQTAIDAVLERLDRLLAAVGGGPPPPKSAAA